MDFLGSSNHPLLFLHGSVSPRIQQYLALLEVRHQMHLHRLIEQAQDVYAGQGRDDFAAVAVVEAAFEDEGVDFSFLLFFCASFVHVWIHL